jgi:hypothetical protein
LYCSATLLQLDLSKSTIGLSGQGAIRRFVPAGIPEGANPVTVILQGGTSNGDHLTHSRRFGREKV